jgi:amino acid adenylation domain-containing protein
MKFITEYLIKHASENPNKIALKDSNGTLTYHQLDRLSSLLAGSLSKRISKGDVVAVYVGYQKEILLGAFSILKAGGVYLPLDSNYPSDRLSFMLENSNAKIILTTKEFYKEHPLDTSLDVLFMDEEKSDCEIHEEEADENSIAFILYTSGTTGRPKGVLHSHKMLTSFNNWREAVPESLITEKSNVAILTGFTFIGTNDFLFSTIKEGGSLFFVDDDTRKDLNLLYQFIKTNQITHIFLPSSLAAIMAEMMDTSIVHIFAAGEKLRNFKPKSNKAKIYNAYGCTEVCGIFSCKVNGDEEVMPLGYLAPDTMALIVDEEMNHLKDGEIGELCVSNERMSHGYLNLPELNREKWFHKDGLVFFRTGDRVKKEKDNRYYIYGRIDNMIKLRGFRIETGEVENQIVRAFQRMNLNIKDVVVVLKNVNNIDRLCCFYESDSKIDENSIKTEIKSYLAEYMIPDIFNNLKSMPRNANGKIMRNQLPQPEIEDYGNGVIQNENEARFLLAMKEYMHLKDGINLEHSFSEYGGTSIQAMGFATYLKDKGIKIEGASLLKSPSLRKVVQNAGFDYLLFWSSEEREKVKKIYQDYGMKFEDVLPLTNRQKRIALDMVLHPDMAHLQKVIFLQVDSVLSEHSIRKVVDTLYSENRQLRASVAYKGVSYSQLVITDRMIPYQIIRSDKKQAMMDIYEGLISKPLDSQLSPLFSLTVLIQEGQSMIYLMVNELLYSKTVVRNGIRKIMEVLHSDYPTDNSVNDWLEILSLNIKRKEEEDENEKAFIQLDIPQKKKDIEDVFTYSSIPGKKNIFFIHTGNSASDAYYHLAERIKNDVSFYVVEPHNLYHSNDAIYGIKNIAKRYISYIQRIQPHGPYILGGWCYGGVLAHEMASQLEQMDEKVELVIMLDSHAVNDPSINEEFSKANENVDKEYFMTSPLFQDIREKGMLEEMIDNAKHVYQDLKNHCPTTFHGNVLYFKPKRIPAGLTKSASSYWEDMMKYKAGNYEMFCDREKLEILLTPDEHDLMMRDSTLDIVIPAIKRKLGI